MDNPTEEQSNEPKGGSGKRKIIVFGAIGLAIIAGALFYFFYLQSPNRQVLARVNDEKVTVEQFNKELAKVETPLIRDMLLEEPDKFLEGVIMKTLILQEAKKQGLSAPVKTYKDTTKDTTKGPTSPEESMITEFMEKKFSSPPEVTREEVEGFYKLYKDRMEGKPLKEVAPGIEQLIREMKQREAFGQYLGDLRKNAKVEIDQNRLQKIAAKPPESNTEEELKQALASGKPVLVDFGANSCLPCRQMRPVLKEINTQYSEKAKVLVIDVYKYQKLAQEHKVLLIPTLVFFDPKGKEAFRNVGIMEKEKIVAKLKEIGMGT
jgi:thioredoxin 1